MIINLAHINCMSYSRTTYLINSRHCIDRADTHIDLWGGRSMIHEVLKVYTGEGSLLLGDNCNQQDLFSVVLMLAFKRRSSV